MVRLGLWVCLPQIVHSFYTPSTFVCPLLLGLSHDDVYMLVSWVFFKGTGAGKLVTPPQPPARSPTTELTSKSGVSAWATAHDPYTPLKNGNMHIIGNIIKLNLFALVNNFCTKSCVCLRPQKLTQDLALAITG